MRYTKLEGSTGEICNRHHPDSMLFAFTRHGHSATTSGIPRCSVNPKEMTMEEGLV